jgi:hypothetical protein
MNKWKINGRNVTFEVEQILYYNSNVTVIRYVKTFFIVLISNLWRLYENGASSSSPHP